MVLNKRERHIAIGAGATLGLLIVYYFVNSFYFDPRAQAQDGIAAAQAKIDDYNSLMTQMPSLNKKWMTLQDEGLQVDEAQAEGQLRTAILKWADDSTIVLDTTQTPHATVQPQFPQFEVIDFVVGFQIQGNRAMYSLAHLLWAIESAQVPFEVNDLQLKSVKDGQDQLTVTLKVTALCMPPEEAPDNAPANTPAAAATPNGDM